MKDVRESKLIELKTGHEVAKEYLQIIDEIEFYKDTAEGLKNNLTNVQEMYRQAEQRYLDLKDAHPELINLLDKQF